jgi:hypothetical protein
MYFLCIQYVKGTIQMQTAEKLLNADILEQLVNADC